MRAAAVAACESWLMVAVVSRTVAAVSSVLLVNSETLPRSPWAAWKTSRAVRSKLSRRACSSRTISWLLA
ncbi:MAG: hypothetical protein QM767_03590 [Anaeromyxobacter sp.]